jgi:hypothetical protein
LAAMWQTTASVPRGLGLAVGEKLQQPLAREGLGTP